jgi:type II secretory pathway pseudopilin PulG
MPRPKAPFPSRSSRDLRWTDQSGASLLQLVIVVAIVAIVFSLALSRFRGDTSDGDAAGPGPPDMVSSLDHSRQRQTLAAMETIARANDVRRAETGRYADRIADLAVPGQRLDLDGWGRPYVYTRDGATYTLTSLGADGRPGPAPPVTWTGAPYEPDLTVSTGRFTQAPNP